MSQRPVITLTTDFGTEDPYVVAMKGVILSINPDTVIVDVTHAVPPQRVEQGAFLLQAALPYLPPRAVHVAVVDPGVGTERRAIAIDSGGSLFVGPDNGVLSPALPDEARAGAAAGGSRLPLPAGLAAVSLTNARYHRTPVSDTFHGRDIFAAVAAHLSLGVDLSDLGEPAADAILLPPFRARRQPDGSLAGRVLHVDGFGNLITDVRREDLPAGEVSVEVRGRAAAGPRRTYAEATGLTALFGSWGYLEIALPGGSAAGETRADIGDPVTVRALG